VPFGTGVFCVQAISPALFRTPGSPPGMEAGGYLGVRPASANDREDLAFPVGVSVGRWRT